MPNGDEIHGTTGNGEHTAIGKGIQQVSISAERENWREFVRHDLAVHRERIMYLLIAVCILFALGAFATGMVIRGFDMVYLNFDRQDQRFERRMERIERMIPTPTPWGWPGGMP